MFGLLINATSIKRLNIEYFDAREGVSHHGTDTPILGVGEAPQPNNPVLKKVSTV